MGKGEQHNDPKYVCHQKYYELAPRVADLILLENVPEYNVEEVVRRELGNTWKCVSAVVDPRLFGFGTSRARVYGLAWKKGCFIEDPGFPLLRTLEALKARPMMMAKNFFGKRIALLPNFLIRQPFGCKKFDLLKKIVILNKLLEYLGPPGPPISDSEMPRHRTCRTMKTKATIGKSQT